MGRTASTPALGKTHRPPSQRLTFLYREVRRTMGSVLPLKAPETLSVEFWGQKRCLCQ